MNTRNLLAVATALLLVAACTESPTAGISAEGSEAVRDNGGFGSGNRSETDGLSTTTQPDITANDAGGGFGSGDRSETDVLNTTTQSDTTAERAGGGFGSGN